MLDIGGQDTKVIALGAGGRVIDFEMNDKCAAGTGKFLEVMARALGSTSTNLRRRRSQPRPASRSPPCVPSLPRVRSWDSSTAGRTEAQSPQGLQDVVAKRTVSSLARVGAEGPMVFAGGVANNVAMVGWCARGFAGDVLVPEETQTVGALERRSATQREPPGRVAARQRAVPPSDRLLLKSGGRSPPLAS